MKSKQGKEFPAEKLNVVNLRHGRVLNATDNEYSGDPRVYRITEGIRNTRHKNGDGAVHVHMSVQGSTFPLFVIEMTPYLLCRIRFDSDYQ